MTPIAAPAPSKQAGWGATTRKDPWWIGPSLTFLALLGFLIYANYVVFFVRGYFEIRVDKSDFFRPDNAAVAPYLAPFHAPLLFDTQSHHAWIHEAQPSWWWGFPQFSSAMLILIFPAGFRFTCYYYRKAYYRSWWQDPPGCAVGEPTWRKTYWGENHWPLLIQNIHRYFMYFAIIFILLLTWDALYSFSWPTLDANGRPTGSHQFGMGLGTLLLIANVVLLSLYTFGCHSFRHLIGGRLNCFSCPAAAGVYQPGARFKLWRWSTFLNENHMLWAWCSLFSVGFADLYIRLCAAGIWNDPRIF